MTTAPFYEPRILKIPLEKHAEIAIDGGLWLVGERLAQGFPSCVFVPDSRYAYKPRHLGTAIIELCRVNENLRHRIFIAGFLKLPDNGAQDTFRRLLVTHAEMLNDAFRTEWERRCRKMIDVGKPRKLAARAHLHKLTPPR